MHPIERLRHVAQAEGVNHALLVREAALALAAFGDDPVGTVTACRRLVARHPGVGPMWWLAARVLTAGDAVAGAWCAVQEIEADPTPGMLARSLPGDATALVLGWPHQVGEALRRRGDVAVLLVDCGGESRGLARHLGEAGLDVVAVPDAGLGGAVTRSDLVVLEASALGPGGFVATSGSRAAAAVAHHAGIPVWVVAGVGRALPAPLWDAMADALGREGREPWERDLEVVPLELAGQVIGPEGPLPAREGGRRSACPVPPELLRAVG